MAVIVVVLLVLVVYGGDFLWLRYRMATNRNPFGSVTRDVYYSVKLKSGKTEFSYGGQQSFECPQQPVTAISGKALLVRQARRKTCRSTSIPATRNNPSLY